MVPHGERYTARDLGRLWKVHRETARISARHAVSLGYLVEHEGPLQSWSRAQQEDTQA